MWLLDDDSGTLFLHLTNILFELIPKWKCTALTGPYRIDRTSLHRIIKENTGEITLFLSWSLYQTITMLHLLEVYCSEIFDILLQKSGNRFNFIDLHPDITALARAAVSPACSACGGIKRVAISLLLYQLHVTSFFPDRDIADFSCFFSENSPNPSHL